MFQPHNFGHTNTKTPLYASYSHDTALSNFHAMDGWPVGMAGALFSWFHTDCPPWLQNPSSLSTSHLAHQNIHSTHPRQQRTTLLYPGPRATIYNAHCLRSEASIAYSPTSLPSQPHLHPGIPCTLPKTATATAEHQTWLHAHMSSRTCSRPGDAFPTAYPHSVCLAHDQSHEIQQQRALTSQRSLTTDIT